MEKNKMEVWKNEGRGDIYIKRLDANNRERSELVPPGREVRIDPEERMLNQSMAYDVSADIFSNGRLSAVKIFDTAEDYEEIVENPNSRSDQELLGLISEHGTKFKAEVEKITSIHTLTRLSEILNDPNTDNEKITVAKRDAVDERLKLLRPPLKGKQFDTAEDVANNPVKSASRL